MPVGSRVRNRAALAALFFPIVAMAGLFGWAGQGSSGGPVSVVDQFISAFNSHDCSQLLGVLYEAPGEAAPSCSQLVGRSKVTLSSCAVALVPKGQASSITTAPPAGYSDPEVVHALCNEQATVNGKPKSEVADVDFLVATSASGLQQIITLQQSPS